MRKKTAQEPSNGPEILITVVITGESAEEYMDVHKDLIFEDFIGRHTDSVQLVSVQKIKGGK